MSDYQIDINLSSEELITLNSSLETGLSKFTEAAKKLELASKKVSEDVNFDAEIASVKSALAGIATHITSATTGDINNIAASVRLISTKLQTIATGLDVTGFQTSVTASTTGILKALAEASSRLNTPSSRTAQAAQVTQVNLDVLNVISATVAQPKAATLDNLTVTSATATASNVTLTGLTVEVGQTLTLDETAISAIKGHLASVLTDLSSATGSISGLAKSVNAQLAAELVGKFVLAEINLNPQIAKVLKGKFKLEEIDLDQYITKPKTKADPQINMLATAAVLSMVDLNEPIGLALAGKFLLHQVSLDSYILPELAKLNLTSTSIDRYVDAALEGKLILTTNLDTIVNTQLEKLALTNTLATQVNKEIKKLQITPATVEELNNQVSSAALAIASELRTAASEIAKGAEGGFGGLAPAEIVITKEDILSMLSFNTVDLTKIISQKLDAQGLAEVLKEKTTFVPQNTEEALSDSSAVQKLDIFAGFLEQAAVTLEEQDTRFNKAATDITANLDKIVKKLSLVFTATAGFDTLAARINEGSQQISLALSNLAISLNRGVSGEAGGAEKPSASKYFRDQAQLALADGNGEPAMILEHMARINDVKQQDVNSGIEGRNLVDTMRAHPEVEESAKQMLAFATKYFSNADNLTKRIAPGATVSADDIRALTTVVANSLAYAAKNTKDPTLKALTDEYAKVAGVSRASGKMVSDHPVNDSFVAGKGVDSAYGILNHLQEGQVQDSQGMVMSSMGKKFTDIFDVIKAHMDSVISKGKTISDAQVMALAATSAYALERFPDSQPILNSRPLPPLPQNPALVHVPKPVEPKTYNFDDAWGDIPVPPKNPKPGDIRYSPYQETPDPFGNVKPRKPVKEVVAKPEKIEKPDTTTAYLNPVDNQYYNASAKEGTESTDLFDDVKKLQRSLSAQVKHIFTLTGASFDAAVKQFELDVKEGSKTKFFKPAYTKAQQELQADYEPSYTDKKRLQVITNKIKSGTPETVDSQDANISKLVQNLNHVQADYVNRAIDKAKKSVKSEPDKPLDMSAYKADLATSKREFRKNGTVSTQNPASYGFTGEVLQEVTDEIDKLIAQQTKGKVASLKYRISQANKLNDFPRATALTAELSNLDGRESSVASDNTIAKKDRTILGAAKFKMDKDRLELNDSPGLELSDLDSQGLSEKGLLELRKAYNRYVDSYETLDKQLAKQLQTKINNLKIGGDYIVESNPYQEGTSAHDLFALYEQKVAEIIGKRIKTFTLDQERETRDAYENILEQAQKNFDDNGVVDVPEAPLGFRDLEQKRKTLLNQLQKKLADDLLKTYKSGELSSQEIQQSLADNKTQLGSNYANLESKAKSQVTVPEMMKEFDKAVANLELQAAKRIAANIVAIDKSKQQVTSNKLESLEIRAEQENAKQTVNKLKEEVLDGFDPSRDRNREVTRNQVAPNYANYSTSEKNQADVLITSANEWLKTQTKKFDDKKLSEAKDALRLGNDSPLKQLNRDILPTNQVDKDGNAGLGKQTSNMDKIRLAYQQFIASETAATLGLTKQQKSTREKLNTQMVAALGDLTDQRDGLIRDAVEAVKRYRQQNPNEMMDGNKPSLMADSLRVIENRGLKGQKESPDNKKDVNLQEIAGLYYTFYNLFKNVRDFAAGIISAATALSSQIIRLNIVNSNNLKQTTADIQTAMDQAKSYGGSVASYLQTTSGFKTANMQQFDRYGTAQEKKFSSAELSSLTEGLTAAFSVNQLSQAERADGNTAILQVLAKGQVASEELKRQLANHLPGAVALFAQSQGVSTQVLETRLKRGEVEDTALISFGELLKNVYSGGAKDVNLANESYKLQGKVSDITTAGTQPIATVGTPALQVLNAIASGLTGNAGAITLAMLPVGTIIGMGLSGIILDSLKRSALGGEAARVLAGTFRANMLPLGMAGGAIGLGMLGSSMLGTGGLDKSIGGFFQKVSDKMYVAPQAADKDALEGPAVWAKGLTELLPIVMLAYAGLSSLKAPLLGLADGAIGLAQNLRFRGMGTPTQGPLPAMGNLSTDAAGNSRLSGITGNLLMAGVAVVAGTAAYLTANTHFLGEYERVTDKMIAGIARVNTGKTGPDETLAAINSQADAFNKKGGQLSWDLGTFMRNELTASTTGDLKILDPESFRKQYGLNKDMIANGRNVDPETTKRFDDEAARRVKQGAPDIAGSYTSETEARQQKGLLNSGNILLKNVKDLLSDSRPEFGDARTKADPILKELREASKLLLKLETSDSTQDEINKQITVVTNLKNKLRSATKPINSAEIQASLNIKNLDEQKTAFINSNTDLGKQNTPEYKAKLDNFDRQKDDMSLEILKYRQKNGDYNPDNTRTDATITNERRLGLADRKETALQREIAAQKLQSYQYRSGDSGEYPNNLRLATIEAEGLRRTVPIKQEKLALAQNQLDLVNQLVPGEKRDAEVKQATEGVKKAMDELRDATMSLTTADIARQAALDDSLFKRFEQDKRNYGYDTIKRPDYDQRVEVDGKIQALQKKLEAAKLSESKSAEVNQASPDTNKAQDAHTAKITEAIRLADADTSSWRTGKPDGTGKFQGSIDAKTSMLDRAINAQMAGTQREIDKLTKPRNEKSDLVIEKQLRDAISGKTYSSTEKGKSDPLIEKQLRDAISGKTYPSTEKGKSDPLIEKQLRDAISGKTYSDPAIEKQLKDAISGKTYPSTEKGKSDPLIEKQLRDAISGKTYPTTEKGKSDPAIEKQLNDAISGKTYPSTEKAKDKSTDKPAQAVASEKASTLIAQEIKNLQKSLAPVVVKAVRPTDPFEIIKFATQTKAESNLAGIEAFFSRLDPLKAEEYQSQREEYRSAATMARFNFQDQSIGLKDDRKDAQASSILPKIRLFDAFTDRLEKLDLGVDKAERGLSTNTAKIANTKQAMAGNISPEERGNLAVKLIQLETEAIKRKYDVEMAGIEKARAMYNNILTIVSSRMGSINTAANNNIAELQRSLNMRLAAQNGMTTSQGGQVSESRQVENKLQSAVAAQRDIGKVIDSSVAEKSTMLRGQGLTENALNVFSRAAKATPRQAGDIVNNINSFLAKIEQTPGAVQPKEVNVEGVTVPFEQLKILANSIDDITKTTVEKKQQLGDEVTAAQLAKDAVTAKDKKELRNLQQAGEAERRNLGTVETSSNDRYNSSINEAKIMLDALRAKASNRPEDQQLKLNQTNLAYQASLNSYNSQVKAAEQDLQNVKDDRLNNAVPTDSDNAKFDEQENTASTKLKSVVKARTNVISEAFIELMKAMSADSQVFQSLLDNVAAKAKETAEIINSSQSTYENFNAFKTLGKQGMVADVIPTIIKDTKGNETASEKIITEKYDPNVYGGKDLAATSIALDKQIAQGEMVSRNLKIISKASGDLKKPGTIENLENFQALDATRQAMILEARDISGNSEVLRENILALIALADASSIKPADKEALMAAKRAQIALESAGLDRTSEIESSKSRQSSINGQYKYGSMDSRQSQDEERVLQYRLQRKQFDDDFTKSTSGRNANDVEFIIAQRTKANKERDLDTEFKKLPLYGTEFVSKIEDAVATGARFSEEFRKAIESGSWKEVLPNILANIFNNLADKFSTDASNGLSDIIGGGIKGLFGITGLPSKSMGDLPSLSTGTLCYPSYSSGFGMSGSYGKAGSSYPKTPTQDPRESGESRLAVINRDEMVVSAQEVQSYLNHRNANIAAQTVNPTYNNNNSDGSSHISYSVNNYQSTSSKTFGLAERYRDVEKKSRAERLS